MRFLCLTSFVFCFYVASIAFSDEQLFSGPQVGEELPAFDAQYVFGENAGTNLSVLENGAKAPTLLVFVHQVTRPSIGLARLVMNFANAKRPDGLYSRLILLTDDPTETEAWCRRARRALPVGVTPMISMDGLEGPGAYGLNRKVTLTVLVADNGKVTANFPLVQPSIQADATKIGLAVVKTLGGDTAPTLKEMGFEDPHSAKPRRGRSPVRDGVYRQLMSPVIQKTTTNEVDAAGKEVEAFAKKNPWFRERVHKAANQIIRSGKLSNYGTPQAQKLLTKWARELALPEQENDDRLGNDPQTVDSP